METLKNENANVENVNIANETKKDASKKKDAKKKESLNKANLSNFADKLKKFGITENSKAKNQKSLLYNYPENFTSLQINSDEGKKFRARLRNELKKHFDKISIAQTIFENKGKKDSSNVVAAIKDFKAWYKTNFKVNDFTLNSITHKTNTELTDYYAVCLNIVLHYESKKK